MSHWGYHKLVTKSVHVLLDTQRNYLSPTLKKSPEEKRNMASYQPVSDTLFWGGAMTQ